MVASCQLQNRQTIYCLEMGSSTKHVMQLLKSAQCKAEGCESSNDPFLQMLREWS